MSRWSKIAVVVQMPVADTEHREDRGFGAGRWCWGAAESMGEHVRPVADLATVTEPKDCGIWR
ncbi:hypothetical protein [Nonomuraea dietziae]|uniref:Uncharacterized protein n=1 Tax=Nonomuraea dietziae TaxID=65515 RepID=A0A7W5UXU3_9ACTN|nr:hypothetical protein [Nonomuraea dietziae]MBB3725009.1 hypothetical protein [Nonomuraea dietziae]